jgi:hypothetical protein
MWITTVIVREKILAAVFLPTIAGVLIAHCSLTCEPSNNISPVPPRDAGPVSFMTSAVTGAGLGASTGSHYDDALCWDMPDGGTCMAYANFNGNAQGLFGTAALQTGLVYPPQLFKSIDSWIGPHTGERTYTQCFTSSQITVGGGFAILGGANNIRTSCPSDWDASAPWWPAGPTATSGPTSYDVSAMQTATFTFTYGTIEKRLQMIGGNALWATNWIAGANCISPSVPAAFMNGGYIGSDGAAPGPGASVDGGCNWPWGFAKSGESDTDELVNIHPATPTGNNYMDVSAYVDCDSGAPSLAASPLPPWGNYCGIVEYIPNSSFTGDLTSSFHTYKLRWYPGIQQLIVDGVVLETYSYPWIANYAHALVFYNELNYDAVPTFTTPEYVDYVEVYCEPGQTCTVNHE